MIDLYSWNTPNGQKASIVLEELGLPYTLHRVNIQNKEQFAPEFLKINPNGKIPAIVDHDDGKAIRVFESGAILIYLAEKTGKLLAPSGADRAEALSWTLWQTGGLGPMMGQWGHFMNAPEKIPYAIKRFQDESIRLLNVLNQHLNTNEYLAGEFSIADIANVTWTSAGLKIIGKSNPELIEHIDAVRRWVDTVSKRPAVQKGFDVLK
jgi:GST-like protein